MVKKSTAKKSVLNKKSSAVLKKKKPLKAKSKEVKSKVAKPREAKPKEMKKLKNSSTPQPTPSNFGMIAFTLACLTFALHPKNLSESPIGIDRTLSSQVHIPVAPHSVGLFEAEFKAVQGLSVSEKISYWSSYIELNEVGRKKLVQLVTNEAVNDAAPIIPERYDCTTFVETVMALVRSKTSDDILKELKLIRYRNGVPSFSNRNHFVEADWIPNNSKVGVLKDSTLEIAAAAKIVPQYEDKILNRDQWIRTQSIKFNIKGDTLADSNSGSTAVKIHLPYVPILSAKNVLDSIPSGTIVNLVHKNSQHHEVLIAHQGIVIRDGNQLLLRHASRGGRMRTEDFKKYLDSMLTQNRRNFDWPWAGINFNQVSATHSN